MIISRVGYCHSCKNAGRPKQGDVFVVKGSHGFHFYTAHMGLSGYVPHFYRLVKSSGGIVLFERLCAMHGCGITVYQSNVGNKFIYNEQWKGGEMRIKDWNALVLEKDLGYKI